MCVGVLSVGLGPGLDSMSPARSRRSASHAAGTHGRLPQKTGRPGLRRGGVGGYNLHSVPPNSPPDCGTVSHQPRAGCIRLVHGKPSSIVSLGTTSRLSGNQLEDDGNALSLAVSGPVSLLEVDVGSVPGRR